MLEGKKILLISDDVLTSRGLKEKLEPELQKPLEEGRLLIITPFDKSTKRVTELTAEIRNKLMVELADSITVGYASPGGQLEKVLSSVIKSINWIT